MQSEISGADERDDLIQLLIREAGRIMEDAGPDFAMRLPARQADRRLVLDHFKQMAHAIDALTTAAFALNEQEYANAANE